MFTQVFLLSIAIATFTSITQCEKLVAERANVTEWSQKYLYFARFYVTRRSRKSPYYINIEFHNKHTWANNITMHMVFYEYLSNEYRRTVVEIHARACDLLHNDPLFGTLWRNLGVVCPLPSGAKYYTNVTVPLSGYPVPLRKFMVNTTIVITSTNDLILKTYLAAHIE